MLQVSNFDLFFLIELFCNKLFCFARFSVGEVKEHSEGQRARLFTIANPLSGPKLPNQSYLQMWDTSNFLLIKKVAYVVSPLCSLATSPCGKFVATGSMYCGLIDIYSTTNNIEVHFNSPFIFLFFIIHNFLLIDCQTRQFCSHKSHYGSSFRSLPQLGWK